MSPEKTSPIDEISLSIKALWLEFTSFKGECNLLGIILGRRVIFEKWIKVCDIHLISCDEDCFGCIVYVMLQTYPNSSAVNVLPLYCWWKSPRRICTE